MSLPLYTLQRFRNRKPFIKIKAHRGTRRFTRPSDAYVPNGTFCQSICMKDLTGSEHEIRGKMKAFILQKRPDFAQIKAEKVSELLETAKQSGLISAFKWDGQIPSPTLILVTAKSPA